ncbi:MAG TPA: T9SS type A sorting domain-containing protein [Chitinophagales bacterium]|nr:T9SS type A sorting domain-containing protein [Chitinophagales bacterium]
MKKLLPGIIAVLLFCSNTFAQYCGPGNPSGPSQCTSSNTQTYPGFTHSEDIDCITRGVASTTVIEYRYFDSIWFAGMPTTVDWVRLDSIENLPAGLCWASSVANNTFSYGSTGCIKLTGTAVSPPGQYKLRIKITALLNGQAVTTDGEAAGIRIYLRVVEPSFVFCPPLDSSNEDYTNFQGNYENMVHISGKMYYDLNANHIYDSGDYGVLGRTITVGDSNTATANVSGNYHAYVPAGTYTLKPVRTDNLDFVPDSLILNALTAGANYPGQDFAVIVPPGYCQGSLNIIAQNPPPRPGFENTVTVSFFNAISASPIDATLILTYNNSEDYMAANPAPTNVDVSARQITWTISNLANHQTFSPSITFYTAPSVSLGTVRHYTADIINSNCVRMDSLLTSHEVTVVGSYDPNDKAVSPAGFGANGAILPSTPLLTYTVRFQNTGTYEAENVKVIDSMTTRVDMASLELLATSHPCEVYVKNRVVTFQFNGIHLPDSFSNEPMSHGYIQYSIKPKSTFVHGTVIENRADIYFDFNAPILTNTTRSTADNFASIAPVSSSGTFNFVIYPNPLADGSLQLEADEQLKGEEVEIKDINGRLLSKTKIAEGVNILSVKDMPAGVYLVKVGNLIKRLIKQ